MTALPNIPARAPVGVRCNNPLNMRRNDKDKWEGLLPLDQMTDEQKQDAATWFVFATPADGFRASAIALKHAYDFAKALDGSPVNTLTKQIGRWAPPSENPTSTYVVYVCKLTGFEPDQILDFHAWDVLRPVMKAMSMFEQGAWLFEDKDLDAGLRRAGAKEPVTTLAKSRTVKAGLAGGGISVISAVEAVQQIKPAVDTLSQIKEYWPLAASVIFAVFFAYIVYWRVDDWMRAKR